MEATLIAPPARFLVWSFGMLILALGSGWCERGAGAEPYQIRQAIPITQPWRISRFTELEGRGVRCLAEDTDGHIWFGVRDGVLRYDGLNWEHEGAPLGLPNVPIESIASRPDGTIVAATDLGLFQRRGERWEQIFPRGNRARLPITFVAAASNGDLWACCSWGLLRLRGDQSTLFTSPEFLPQIQRRSMFDLVVALPPQCLARKPFPRGTGIALIGDTVALLSDDSPASAAGLRIGDVILEVAGGSPNTRQALEQNSGKQLTLIVKRKATGQQEPIRFQTTDIVEKYRSPAMHFVREDRHGRIWVAAMKDRVFATDDGGGSWQFWPRAKQPGIGTRPSILEANDGEIWVVSSSRSRGISRYDGATWSSEHRPGLTGFDYVSGSAQTVDGTVWISGLNRLHVRHNGEWNSYDTRNVNLPSESHRMLVASDQSLWICGYGQFAVRIVMSPDEYLSLENLQHLCREANGTRWYLESTTNRIIRQSGDKAVAYGMDDGLLSDPAGVLTTQSGEVLAFGNHDNIASVATFDGTGWQRTEFPEVARDLSGKGFMVSRKGEVWIAARGNRDEDQVGGVLVRRVDGRWHHFKPPDAPIFATSIVELPDGRIMLSAGWGVVIYDGATWRQQHHEFLVDTPCPDSTIDRTGAVWVATRTQGVLRFRNNQWRKFTVADGLPANDATSITATGNGDVWVNTSGGLCRFDGRRFQHVNLPSQLGRNSLRPGLGNAVWFDGRHRYNPDTSAPIVAMDQDEITLEPGASTMATWQGRDMWNRTPADQLSWSYRIDGGPWSQYRQERRAVLQGLPTGSHALQVRARDSDFNESIMPPTLRISVLPPFWQRPWFLAVATVFFTALIWQSVNLIRRGAAIRHTNEQLALAKLELADRFAEKSAQFRAICDCSPIGIFVSDPQGHVTYFNPHMKRLAGISTKAAIADGWTQTIHADDRQQIVADWQHSVNDAAAFRGRGRFVHQNGAFIQFEVVTERIEHEGELLGYVGAVEDVTERSLAYEALNETNARLRSALKQLKTAKDHEIHRARLRALGQMAAGVAHDMNNTLTPLLNYSELLAKDEAIEGTSREWVELLRLGISDSANVVKRLDHFYRESDKPGFWQPVDLCQIITQAVALTRPKWESAARADGKTVELRIETEDAPEVDAEPAQIRSVLTNLIFNAVDAIDGEGTVTIRLAEWSDQACLEVVDDGIGMTAEQLENCLEPFYTSKPDGTGLGLSECDVVVRQFGGIIKIESTHKQGTRVQILLPASSTSSPVASDAPASSSESTSDLDFPTASDTQSVSGPVLYIEDDAAVRKSTVALLNSMGIDVETAADGPTGLRRLEQTTFQLVVCDQGLPGMDGLTVLTKIKEQWPDLPVVIASGWSLPETQCRQPDAFLQKPISHVDMADLMRRFLGSLSNA